MAEISQYKKTDLFKRFLAFLIDYIIATLVSVIPFVGWLIGAAYMVFRDGFDFNFMKHRSLGKHIMKLKIVNIENESSPVDLKTSFQRNWIFSLPVILAIIPVLGLFLSIPLAIVIYSVEGVKVINDPSGRRYGDEFAKTIVSEE